MDKRLIRCPGTNGNGCEAMLPLDAGGCFVCFVCGTEFDGAELFDLYVAEVGWMDEIAELGS